MVSSPAGTEEGCTMNDYHKGMRSSESRQQGYPGPVVIILLQTASAIWPRTYTSREILFETALRLICIGTALILSNALFQRCTKKVCINTFPYFKFHTRQQALKKTVLPFLFGRIFNLNVAEEVQLSVD